MTDLGIQVDGFRTCDLFARTPNNISNEFEFSSFFLIATRTTCKNEFLSLQINCHVKQGEWQGGWG